MKLAFFLIAVTGSSLFAQNPTFEWVKQMGAIGVERGNDIAVDQNGNVYTTGQFNDSMDFDPGIGTSFLTSNGSKDIFIQKLDKNGNFIWARQMGGLGFDIGQSITTDALGNVLTIGEFRGTVDFDPGTGVFNLVSNGNTDIFIQKLDSNGMFVWAKSMGGIDADFGKSITTDVYGDIFTTGSFQKTVDFDPGTGTLNLLNSGRQDIFIQKLSSSGNLVWAKSIGGTSNELGSSITIDQNENILLTGAFIGNVDFDPNVGSFNLVSVGSYDIFVQKLTSTGNLIWVKRMGGLGADFGLSIVTDTIGDAYITGYFADTCNFDPGANGLFLTSKGGADIFTQKLDVNGLLLWVNQAGGLNNDNGFAVTIGSKGDIYTVGSFSSTVDFDPGVDTLELTSRGGSDVFVQKLTPNGDLLGISQMGGIENDNGYAIATDYLGDICLTGSFRSICDFDPDTSIFNLTTIGNDDIFVQKLRDSSLTTSIKKSNTLNHINLYPNPTNGSIIINLKNIQEAATVQLYSISGQLLQSYQFLNSQSLHLNIDYPNGLYLLRIIDEKGNRSVFKLIKE